MQNIDQLIEHTDIELSPDDLRYLGKTSIEFFLEYFLAEEIDEADFIQDFHILTFSRFIDLDHVRDVVALPRGHAKTTYLRLAFVYLMYYTPISFLVMICADKTAASASLSVIWDYITGVEGQEMFGYPHAVYKEAMSDGWYEFKITAYDENMEPYEKYVILRGIGQGQRLRGMNLKKKRPQFMGFDDAEDDTAIKTQEGKRKFSIWFNNTAIRALDRKFQKVAQIGNLVGEYSLLNDNLRDPDYRSLRLGVLRPNGKPLWPTMWTLEQIRADILSAARRGELGEWMGEMMNIPTNVENGLIAPEDIKYTPKRHFSDGRIYSSFITIDPADDKTTSDHVAMVLHTIDSSGMLQQTAYRNQVGMDAKDMADQIEEWHNSWGTCLIGCESVQLQKFLIKYFEVEFKIRMIFGLEFVEVLVGRQHKTNRLKTYAAAHKSFRTSIPEGDWEITQQFLQFDVTKDNNVDDLLDASSMGQYMLDHFMDQILKPTKRTETLTRPKAQPSTSMV